MCPAKTADRLSRRELTFLSNWPSQTQLGRPRRLILRRQRVSERLCRRCNDSVIHVRAARVSPPFTGLPLTLGISNPRAHLNFRKWRLRHRGEGLKTNRAPSRVQAPTRRQLGPSCPSCRCPRQFPDRRGAQSSGCG